MNFRDKWMHLLVKIVIVNFVVTCALVVHAQSETINTNDALLYLKHSFEICRAKKSQLRSEQILDRAKQFCDSKELLKVDDQTQQKFAMHMHEIIQSKPPIELWAEMQEKLANKTIEMMASQWAEYAYRYRGNTQQVFITQKNKLMQSVCYKEGVCTVDTKLIIDLAYENKWKELQAANVPSWSVSEATRELNQAINDLNDMLKKVQLPKQKISYHYMGAKSGNVPSYPDPVFDEDSKSRYEEYVMEYLWTVAEGVGLFLVTDEIRTQVGEPRELGLNHMRWHFVDSSTSYLQYEFVPHKTIDENTFQKAFKAAEAGLVKHAKNVIKIKNHLLFDRNNLRERFSDVSKLLELNPVAATHVLMNDPHLVWVACFAMEKLDRRDQWRERRDRVWFWSGVVVGTAFTLTGIGSYVGTPILAGIVSAKTVATAGAIFGLAQTIYAANKSLERRFYISSLRNSALAGNIDAKLMDDLELTIKEHEALQRDAYIIGITTLIFDGTSVATSLTSAKKVRDFIAFLKRKNMRLTHRIISQKGVEYLRNRNIPQELGKGMMTSGALTIASKGARIYLLEDIKYRQKRWGTKPVERRKIYED